MFGNLVEKLKWKRIGYVDGKLKLSENSTLTSRSIMFVREPFLWFKTRKVVVIGDEKAINSNSTTSPHYRAYKMDVQDWLNGGKIDYISDNGTSEPAKIIKLVKNEP